MPRKVSLSFDLLETFIKLVQNDFQTTKTCEDLGINQPSMSKRLAYLQHSGRPLARPWLHLDGKKWSLTTEGERVFPLVEDLVRQYTNLVAAVESEPAGPRIGCGQQGAQTYILKAVQQFNQNAKSVAEVEVMSSSDRIARMLHGTLDLAIVHFTQEELNDQVGLTAPLQLEELTVNRQVAICSESSPQVSRFGKLRKAKPIQTESLGEFPLVVVNRGNIRERLDRNLRRHGLASSLNFSYQVGGWRQVLDFACSGVGVGIVSESILKSYPALAERLHVRRLDPEIFPEIPTNLLCRIRKQAPARPLDLTDEGSALVGLIREQFEG